MSASRRVLIGLALATLVGVNVVAFIQARAMSTFTETGARTESPERLGRLETLRVVFAGVRIPRPRNAMTPAAFGLEHERLTIPSSRGGSLEAWRVPGQPDRALVILFHGYASKKEDLLPAARILHGLGHETLLLDFHGSGGSSGSGTTLSYLEARDVADVFAFSRARWPGRRLVLYGSSMGGAAILRAAAVGGVKPDAVIVEATFDTLLQTTRRRFAAMGLPAFPGAELLLFWGGVQHGFDLFGLQPARDARRIECPALILQAGDDARVSIEDARHLADGFGARGRLVVFPGVPHMPIVQRSPDAWGREVGGFLAAL